MPNKIAPYAVRDSLLARLKRWFGRKKPLPAADIPSRLFVPPTDGRLPHFSDYVLEHVIARTDRTTIYRAKERLTGAIVALKTVSLGQAAADDRSLWRERFLRESAAAARLKYPDIVRVHAGGVHGEGSGLIGWLAMEWVQGTDLVQYATPARLLPESVVLTIATRVALALDFAHRSGVVHRDIKPGNVLFDPVTGAVKVTDFGSARIADTIATRSGVIMGTPAYMAPEQLAGTTATAQCDLYALGVMLFELLTGQRPFESDSMGELLARISRKAPPPLRSLRPDLPELLEDIIARLLAKRPEQRQSSGRRLAFELRLAKTACAAARAAASPTSWADTEPVDFSAMSADAGAARTTAPAGPGPGPAPIAPQKGVIGAPGATTFQGTIGENHPSAEATLRRTMPSS